MNYCEECRKQTSFLIYIFNVNINFVCTYVCVYMCIYVCICVYVEDTELIN